MKQKITNRPEGNPSEGVGRPNTLIIPAMRRILSFALAVLIGVTTMQFQASAAVIVEDLNYPFGRADYVVNSNLTYTKTMRPNMNSTLTVKSPYTLTIEGRIFLHGSSKITIEPGARVVIAPGGSLEVGFRTVLTNGGELVNEGSLYGTGFTLQNNGSMINTGRMYQSGAYGGWGIQGAGRFDNYGDIDRSRIAIDSSAEPNEIAGITAAFSASENKAEVNVSGRLPQGTNSVTIKLFDEHGADTISPSRDAMLASADGATAAGSLDLPVDPVPSTYTVKASFDGAHWAPVTGTVITAAPIPAPVIAVRGGTEIPRGGSLTLEVTNTSDYSVPSYRWYRDGAAIGANSATISATEAGTYRVAVIAKGQTAGSNEITLTAESAPPYTDKPSVSTAGLNITAGESATFTVSLGEGVDAANSANISSDNTAVATSSPVSLGQSGQVTVKGVSKGNATISIGYSGGNQDGQYDEVKVTVTDAPIVPPTTPSGDSTPDSRVAKTQLPTSTFSWDGRTLTIDHERITPLGLLSVQWDGTALTQGTDYTVYRGSVIVRFGADFIAAQPPGDYTVRVEFLNYTGETTVTVGETQLTTSDPNDDLFDNDTHNPTTGDGRSVWPTLLLGSLSGIVGRSQAKTCGIRKGKKSLTTKEEVL